MHFDVYMGLTLAGLGIGPANNLAFVIISETFEEREMYSVSLLCGWATGEILLGVAFCFPQSNNAFITLFLMVPALVVGILVFLFI